jgi:hypothetical protein
MSSSHCELGVDRDNATSLLDAMKHANGIAVALRIEYNGVLNQRTPQEGTVHMASREQRETELKALLGSHNGRNQLTELLRLQLNLPSGQIPVGTPFVQTILDHEFADPSTHTSA